MTSSPPFALERLIHQNSRAISLFHSGDYSSAVRILSCLVSNLGALSDVAAVNMDDDDDDDDDFMEDGMFAVYASSSESTSHRDHQGHHVFRSPIRIGCFHGLGIELTAPLLNQISFVMVYNLALAWHLEALEQQHQCNIPVMSHSTACTPGLQKALALYDVALRLAAVGSCSGGSNMLSRLEDMESLAIVNNQAQIHQFLGAHDAAKACHAMMLPHLLHLSTMAQQQQHQQQQREEDAHPAGLSGMQKYHIDHFLASATRQDQCAASA